MQPMGDQEDMTQLKRELMWAMMEKESAMMVSEKKQVESLQIRHALIELLKIAWKERDEAKEQVERLSSVSNHMALTSTVVVDDYYNMQIDNLFAKAAEKPLPEKGKLKQAVQASGQLLKTLLDESTPPQKKPPRNWQDSPPISSYLENKNAALAELKSVKSSPISLIDHENINNISISHQYCHDGVVLPVEPSSSSSTMYQDDFDFARGSASSSDCFNGGGMSNPDWNYQIYTGNGNP